MIKDCQGVHTTCYSVITIRHSIYGASIIGAGKSLLIDCGLYKNGIIFRSDEYLKRTERQTIDKNNEVVTDTYASSGNVDVVLDSVVKTQKYEIDPYTLNYQGVATFLLALVSHQCEVLLADIKSPKNYLDIIAANQAILPELNVEVERLLAPYKNATAYKNQQQDFFDDKLREHHYTILSTVFAVLPPLVVAWFLMLHELEANNREYAGYYTCGADLNSTCSWSYHMYKARIAKDQHVKSSMLYAEVVEQQGAASDEDIHETEMTALCVDESSVLNNTHHAATTGYKRRLDLV